MVDVYGNMHNTGSDEGMIFIVAHYVNHDEWDSPIGIEDYPQWQSLYGRDIAGVVSNNQDGTYQCQITVQRAGLFSLKVTINN